MITILAEKPSVARDIAAIVGATNKADGYIHGGGYAVTWAFGHLVQLAMPEEYGAVGLASPSSSLLGNPCKHDCSSFVRRFNREHLPIIPDNFKLVVRQVREGKIYKSDLGAAKQLKVICKLFDECESIIVATDAGREGELIFRYIYDYLKCDKPFQRLWISSLTDSAIREGLNNLKNGSDYDNLYDAARSRSEADWLVGINASQALTLSAGSGVYSLGRVQTPTLKMICERYKENKEFTSKKYFQVVPHLDNGLKPISEIKYDDISTCDRDSERLWFLQTVTVVDVVEKEINENPPLLYDLTSLQKDANKRCSYTAQETLDIAQKLYEKKFITYPRTGSRYISEDVFAEIGNILTELQTDVKWHCAVGLLFGIDYNRLSVNDNKVTDHHALLPTTEMPTDLSKKEQQIYDMVVLRTIESLMPKCVKSSTTITFDGREKTYISKNISIVEKGWREVRGDKEDDITDIAIPKLSVGEVCHIDYIESITKQTKPKAIHTESSLLSSMETAGKNLTDDAEREAMKEQGLGTPATRAATIETLFTRGYITREGKSLVPTEKGLAVYDAVKDMQIANVQLTGEWENGLCSIEKGQLDSGTFDNVSREYTRQITAELLSKEIQSAAPAMHSCPKCGVKAVRIFDKVTKCTISECGFVIFMEVAGKKLTQKQIEELLSTGKTKTIKGFKSKTGKSFDAALTLNEEYKVTFVFADNKQSNKKSYSKSK